jgi:toxin ParE1/3/4
MYFLARAVANDLREIEEYTASHWGEAQAADYIFALYAAFDMLADNPGLGHRRPDLPKSFRVYIKEHHLIIYRGQDPVEILNILHPAMDIEKRIKAQRSGKDPKRKP